MSDTLIRTIAENLAVLRREHDLLADDVRRSEGKDEEILRRLERHDEKISQLERWRDESTVAAALPKDHIVIALLKTLLAAKSGWYIILAGIVLILIYWVVFQDGLTKLIESL